MARTSRGSRSIVCKEDYDPESAADDPRDRRSYGNRGGNGYRGGNGDGDGRGLGGTFRRVFYIDFREILHFLFLGGIAALIWKGGSGLLRSLRPAALWALMGGIVLGRKAKAAADDAREGLEDLTAEALSKVASERERDD